MFCFERSLLIKLILILSISFETTMASDTSKEICPNVSLACNKFALHLHKALSTSSEDNVIFSPLSVHMILSLLSHGAKGRTLTEMKDGLHLAHDTPAHNEFKSLLNTLNNVEGVGLSLANALYVQKGFELLPNFLELSKDVFDCVVSSVDYEQNVKTAQEINEWIEKATKNKIKDAVSSDNFDSLTRLVLINAIHFKGNWLNRFDITHTRDEEFYVKKSNIKLVPTMFKKFKYPHGELEDWNARFLEIPYVNEDFSMIIILPNEIEGLRSLEEKFTWDILKTTKRSHNKIELYLPKFEIEAKIDLKEALNKLGLQTMFTSKADFSALARTPLQVSQAFQKVYITVDEEGSEAAAATVVRLMKRSIQMDMEEFRVNHPFMIVIQHKPSDMPLFVGSIKHIPASSPLVHEDL